VEEGNSLPHALQKTESVGLGVPQCMQYFNGPVGVSGWETTSGSSPITTSGCGGLVASPAISMTSPTKPEIMARYVNNWDSGGLAPLPTATPLSCFPPMFAISAQIVESGLKRTHSATATARRITPDATIPPLVSFASGPNVGFARVSRARQGGSLDRSFLTVLDRLRRIFGFKRC